MSGKASSRSVDPYARGSRAVPTNPDSTNHLAHGNGNESDPHLSEPATSANDHGYVDSGSKYGVGARAQLIISSGHNVNIWGRLRRWSCSVWYGLLALVGLGREE
jgi:hypothetical protein